MGPLARFFRHDEPLPKWAVYIIKRQDRIERILKLEQLTEHQIMLDVAQLTADVTAETNIVQGVVAFVAAQKTQNDTLAAQVADLKAQLASNPDAAVQAGLNSLDSTVASNNALLSGILPAIVANTPAAADPATAAALPQPSPVDPAAAPAATAPATDPNAAPATPAAAPTA